MAFFGGGVVRGDHRTQRLCANLAQEKARLQGWRNRAGTSGARKGGDSRTPDRILSRRKGLLCAVTYITRVSWEIFSRPEIPATLFLTPLFLDAHFIDNALHAFDGARDRHGTIDLRLIVNKTAELHFAFPGHDADIDALYTGLTEQRRLYPGGDDTVIHAIANGYSSLFQRHAVFDTLDARHGTRIGEYALDSHLRIDKPAQQNDALAGFNLDIEFFDFLIGNQRSFDSRGNDGVVNLGANRCRRRKRCGGVLAATGTASYRLQPDKMVIVVIAPLMAAIAKMVDFNFWFMPIYSWR